MDRTVQDGYSTIISQDGSLFPKIANYQLLDLIGQGGGGRVYLAKQIHLDREVALKIFNHDFDFSDPNTARFRKEMIAAGRLQHPNIVMAHDAGIENNQAYLAMEFVHGIDLAHLLKEQGRLQSADACEIIRQACIGLQHIYDNELVHRDIKLSNLMLDRNGTVKIADLGLASIKNAGQKSIETTEQGARFGTVDYMAPEQWEDSSQVDIRADIYSLGCTFYALLTGKPPWHRKKQIYEKMYSHSHDNITTFEQLNLDVHPSIFGIVSKMVGKLPSDRYQQPKEIALALTEFCKSSDLKSLTVALTDQNTSPRGIGFGSPEINEPTIQTERIIESYGRKRRDPVKRRKFVYLLFFITFGIFGLFCATAYQSYTQSRTPILKMNAFQITAFPLDNKADQSDRIILPNAKNTHLNTKEQILIEFETSLPLHCYMISIKADNTNELLLPANGLQGWDSLPVNFPARIFRFPKEENLLYPIQEENGCRVFIILGSEKPLPAFREFQKELGSSITIDGLDSSFTYEWTIHSSSEKMEQQKSEINNLGLGAFIEQLQSLNRFQLIYVAGMEVRNQKP